MLLLLATRIRCRNSTAIDVEQSRTASDSSASSRSGAFEIPRPDGTSERVISEGCHTTAAAPNDRIRVRPAKELGDHRLRVGLRRVHDAFGYVFHHSKGGDHGMRTQFTCHSFPVEQGR